MGEDSGDRWQNALILKREGYLSHSIPFKIVNTTSVFHAITINVD